MTNYLNVDDLVPFLSLQKNHGELEWINGAKKKREKLAAWATSCSKLVSAFVKEGDVPDYSGRTRGQQHRKLSQILLNVNKFPWISKKKTLLFQSPEHG